MQKTTLKFALCCSLGLVAGSLLGGCSDEAAKEQMASRAEYKAALAKYTAAQLGFVNSKAVGDKPDLDLDEYRQMRLADAAKDLEKLTSKGVLAQQVSVRRFLSDIHASTARHIARQAVVNSSEVGASGAMVMSFLTSVDLSNQLGKAYGSVDESQLINDLSKDGSALQRKLTELTGNVKTLSDKVKQTQDAIATLKQQKDKSGLEAQKIRDQAFTLKGKDQLKAYDNATLTQRKADRASAEAEQLGVKLEVLNSELAILKRQVELIGEATKTVETQSAAAGDRQANAQRVQQEAKKAEDEFSAELLTRLAQWAKEYDEKVEAPLKQAQTEIEESIKIIREARSLAKSEAIVVQVELLMREMDRVYILSQHAIAAENYSRTMKTIAETGSRLIPEKASYLADNAASAAKRLDEIRIQTAQSIEKGTQLASDLAQGKGEADPYAVIANEQTQRLAAYGKRAKISLAPVPAPAPASTPATTATDAADKT